VHQQNTNPTLRLTIFEIFTKSPNVNKKFRICGSLGYRPQKGEDLSGTDMYHRVPNFTPIGATVAEISVTRQRNLKNSKLSMASKKYELEEMQKSNNYIKQ